MATTIIAPAKRTVYPDLGKYCTYAQAVYSEKALRNGLTDNTPSEEQYENMIRVYVDVIEPIALWLLKETGQDLRPGINSFFRSSVPQKKINGIWQSVNSIVGGSPTSDHPNGRAVDSSLRWVNTKLTNIDLAKFAKSEIDFDQLIIEAIDPITKRPAWVHIGERGAEHNRHQILEAKFKNGKPQYSFLA